MMKSHRSLFESKAEMNHCVVVERLGQCISFELFQESDNNFIVACAMDKSGSGSFIFTTFRDCHLRAFADIVALMKDHSDFVGKMSRDWLSGLTFALLNKADEVVCEIRWFLCRNSTSILTSQHTLIILFCF